MGNPIAAYASPRVIPVHQWNCLNLVCNQSRSAIYIMIVVVVVVVVIVVAYKKWLMRPRTLAAAMDQFCYYRGRPLLERHPLLRQD